MLVSAAVAALALATSPPIGTASPAPCQAPERRVACPDLQMRKPYGMRLLRGSQRQFLAATNAIVNTGEGPLEIRARRDPNDKYRMIARQVLRPRVAGNAALVMPATGQLDFYDTRSRGTYWKFKNAASFTLRRIGENGGVGRIQRTGAKIDYCFRDLRKVERLDGKGSYPRAPRQRHFGACSTTPGAKVLTLGTSVGWADIYPWSYPQNSIDVTGLKGCFLYTLKVDPRDELEELDETNNAGSAVVRLPWRGAGRRGCPVPEDAPGL